MREFKGRVVTPGTTTAEAVVTTQGFNTLASMQMALQFGDKQTKCGDQNNPELHGKPLCGKALCLPQTIGSTTGGLVLYCACSMKRQPACMLFGKPNIFIDGNNPALAAGAALIAAPKWDKLQYHQNHSKPSADIVPHAKPGFVCLIG